MLYRSSFLHINYTCMHVQSIHKYSLHRKFSNFSHIFYISSIFFSFIKYSQKKKLYLKKYFKYAEYIVKYLEIFKILEVLQILWQNSKYSRYLQAKSKSKIYASNDFFFQVFHINPGLDEILSIIPYNSVK